MWEHILILHFLYVNNALTKIRFGSLTHTHTHARTHTRVDGNQLYPTIVMENKSCLQLIIKTINTKILSPH